MSGNGLKDLDFGEEGLLGGDTSTCGNYDVMKPFI